jgi:hypothetical protein
MSRAAVPHEYLIFQLLASSRTSEGYPTSVVQAPFGRRAMTCHLGYNWKVQTALNPIVADDANAALPVDGGASFIDRTVVVICSASTAPALI